jgi:Na+/H+ antiporter NhaD/arsenite permease-like protein
MDLGAPLVRASVVLAITLGGCALPRVPGLKIGRPTICLLGGLATIALGVLTLEEAERAVNQGVIGLLLGMMVAAGALTESGLYEHLAASLAGVAKARPRALLAITMGGAALLSALVTNDTVCVFFAAPIIVLCRTAGRRTLPYLLGLALGANTGSAATLIGNPQNAFIGVRAAEAVARGTSHLTFLRYMLLATPVTVVALAVGFLAITLVFRRELDEVRAGVTVRSAERVYDAKLARRALAILAFAAILLVAGVPLPVAALAAAAATLVFSGRDARVLFAHVDVGLLVLFAGLFVVTEGARAAGVIGVLEGHLAPSRATDFAHQAASMAVFTTVGSQVVSNVPFVVAISPWVEQLAAPDGQRALLALVSTFAGNLTLVGSIANLIVAGAAPPDEPVGFFEHLKVGLPVTLVQVGIALGAVVVYERLGWV